MLAVLREQYQAQADSTRGIAGVWQGAAATAAISLLNRQLAVAEVDIAALAEISAGFDRLPEALRVAVRGKAEIVQQILENGTELSIDGKTPEDVDFIIDGADGFGWTHTLSAGSAASRAQALFPDMRLGVWQEFVYGEGGVQSPWSPYQDVISQRCRGWLDELFVPDYERKVRWFGEICAVADDGVRGLYEEVARAFGGLSGEEYARAGGTASETPSGVPVGTVPASAEPVGTAPASTTPAATPSATPPTSTTTASTPTTTSSPAEATSPATTTQSPATSPTSPTTSPTSPATTTPSTTPSVTSPAVTALEGLSTLNSAAQTLTPIAQSVAQSLGTGLSALTDSVTAGIDDALERVQQAFEPVDADGDGHPDDRVLAGFPLGDRHAEVTLGADGRLTLTLTEPGGSSAEYRLETDENGQPVLVQVAPETGAKIDPEKETPDDSQSEPAPDSSGDPAPHDDTAASPEADTDGTPPPPAPADPPPPNPDPGDPNPADPAPGGPTPADPAPGGPIPADPGPANPAPGDPAPSNTPGTGTPSTPRRGEDGEHRPQAFPDSAPADPPAPDSGAQLSEAGPL
ncbi:hypothetical protein [Nocardia harenae]|uniref:hypothetical protein n=1 Tax=Nocardia harenae TaxID=358707 RepID=UPI0012EE073F|nr:hypothetical protein [Nocardia harenae]